MFDCIFIHKSLTNPEISRKYLNKYKLCVTMVAIIKQYIGRKKL